MKSKYSCSNLLFFILVTTWCNVLLRALGSELFYPFENVSFTFYDLYSEHFCSANSIVRNSIVCSPSFPENTLLKIAKIF